MCKEVDLKIMLSNALEERILFWEKQSNISNREDDGYVVFDDYNQVKLIRHFKAEQVKKKKLSQFLDILFKCVCPNNKVLFVKEFIHALDYFFSPDRYDQKLITSDLKESEKKMTSIIEMLKKMHCKLPRGKLTSKHLTFFGEAYDFKNLIKEAISSSKKDNHARSISESTVYGVIALSDCICKNLNKSLDGDTEFRFEEIFLSEDQWSSEQAWNCSLSRRLTFMLIHHIYDALDFKEVAWGAATPYSIITQKAKHYTIPNKASPFPSMNRADVSRTMDEDIAEEFERSEYLLHKEFAHDSEPYV